MKDRAATTFLKLYVLLATLLVITDISSGAAIESGQYFSDALSTNKPSDMSRLYNFYAKPGESVIIRSGHACGDPYPTFALYNPDGSPATVTQVSTNEYHMSVTNDGWYYFTCTIPAATSNMSFNVSMLRFPDAPLSYADLDVDSILSGESLGGNINVSSDLDAGFISISNACTVQIRMGQKSVNLVPNVYLYDPNGILITNAFPPEYRAEITAALTNIGIYTVVCADKFNSPGLYALSFAQIPGTLSSTDPDLGMIIAGETLKGTINQPGDLDIATFCALTGDVVKFTLTEIDRDFDPVIELYNPAGALLATASDVFQEQAVITNTITTNGTFTLICKDTEDRYAVDYNLTFELLSGSSISNLPATPTGVVASDGSYSDRILVTWNSSSGALGYDLWRTYGTNDAVQICTNLSSATYTDYDVTTNIIYYYKVNARNDYGTSDFSESDSGYCGTLVTQVQRLALLIGIDHYLPAYGPTALTACTNDANSMRNLFLLGDPSNRWEAENIQMFTDVQATKATIQEELHTLASSSEAGDLVVYYHSSHGGQSSGSNPSNTFICTYDADYTDAELGTDLAQFLSETRVIVILDTCFSGGMFKDPAILEHWPFAEHAIAAYKKAKRAQLKSQDKRIPKDLGNNIAFMTACNYDEVSWELGNHGLYTGYLLEGCATTSVDTNSDGEYQFFELHAYADVAAAAASASFSYQQHAQAYNTNLLVNTVARGVGSNIVSIAAGIDNDYDGDQISDLAVYNEATGCWYIWSLNNGAIAWNCAWGGPGFMSVTGDYDGDGKADLTVYSEALGLWYIWSLPNGVIAWDIQWGGSGLRPVAGDYNGDGIADLALCDKADGCWYIITLGGDLVIMGTSWTGTGFTAIPGDYNGDLMSDYAMYHNEMGYWYILSPSGSSIVWGKRWGGTGYTPVTGDYDGDGISDMAVYCRELGLWFIWSEATHATITWGTSWGGEDFIPVQGDYNGDGISDLAVYNESTGCWYIQSVDGTQLIASGLTFGGPGFIPVRSSWQARYPFLTQLTFLLQKSYGISSNLLAGYSARYCSGCN